jgi:hypothetical protein
MTRTFSFCHYLSPIAFEASIGFIWTYCTIICTKPKPAFNAKTRGTVGVHVAVEANFWCGIGLKSVDEKIHPPKDATRQQKAPIIHDVSFSSIRGSIFHFKSQFELIFDPNWAENNNQNNQRN